MREEAIKALKTQLNASFCDISYVRTIDPWFKFNQTRYKIFIISEQFKGKPIHDRHDIIKEIAHPFLNNPGDSRVEIVAHTLEEKPEGLFTEEEMKYNFNFMDAPVFGGNRLKREILEFHLSTDKANMDWKFHPNKTCQLVEEIVRKKFDPVIVKCESIKEEVMGRVGPGHEDQYRLLVVSKKFLDQPQLRRTINVRQAIEELVTQQMYKIHMRLKTVEEYEAEKNIETTTNFEHYL
ncbi:hypothetical protein M8J77_005361 [Diaphorina citri]|nr:hypothetical protein M8J77_005361 [Diaphorina citri]